MSWTKTSWDWKSWETWNKVSLPCCCSSPTFFSHKFTQCHTFPRNILPRNVPFQWKTSSVTIFFSQLWLWPARSHGDPLGRAQCICLGVQHPFKRWCYRLRIDSMGPNISAAKMRRIFFFGFFGIVSVQCQGILRTFVSTALQNLRHCPHGPILRSDISRTRAIPAEPNHEAKLWRKWNKRGFEQWN